MDVRYGWLIHLNTSKKLLVLTMSSFLTNQMLLREQSVLRISTPTTKEILSVKFILMSARLVA